MVKKLVTKAVLERNLIEDGDRVLIAVSGGKDSTIMAWALSAARPALKRDYYLAAAHISSDFCACCKKAELAKNLAEWGVSFTDIFTPIIKRLKPGRKMNCYWCSTQRRVELLKYAVENNFNKIALGHHLDDVIETFFMNMTEKGESSTMPLLLKYQKYPVSLIRPLGYVEERQIITCAEEKGVLKAACTCPFGVNSNRRIMKRRIADFTGDSSAVKRRIFKAVMGLS
ncbi:MAG: tRNA 2-thiocytidine biosynthesis TtcA family protein [Treponema sp.]|nr:tRNA 2-thiocytidine biosynthesis TtcA family protein [Treponema sp.]